MMVTRTGLAPWALALKYMARVHRPGGRPTAIGAGRFTGATLLLLMWRYQDFAIVGLPTAFLA